MLVASIRKALSALTLSDLPGLATLRGWSAVFWTLIGCSTSRTLSGCCTSRTMTGCSTSLTFITDPASVITLGMGSGAGTAASTAPAYAAGMVRGGRVRVDIRAEPLMSL